MSSPAEEAERVIDVSSAATLADLAQKMRKYFLTVQAAYGFIFYGSFTTAYWLLVVALAALLNAWSWGPFWTGAMLAMIPLFVTIGYVTSSASPRVASTVWRAKGKYFPLIFASPFVVIYALPWPGPLQVVVWFPALSIALLLQYVLYEREEYRKGEVVARPFLLSSSIGLATSPLVLAAAAASFTAGWALALSLMLFSYSIAGLHALRSARKLIGS